MARSIPPRPQIPRLKIGRMVLAFVGVIAGIVLLTVLATSFGAVPVDQVGLHYTGGPIEGQKFVKVIEPGSGQKFLGLQDTLVKLPVTQRDYVAASGESADGPPILAPAKGGVEMQFEVGAYFALNTSDEIVKQFYERICTKFNCTEQAGWDQMLEVNFRRPIEQAIQQSVRRYSVDQLYAGQPGQQDENTTEEEATEVLVRVQEDIANDLRENINNILGGKYFCGPTFNRATPDECPDFEFQITKAIPTDGGVIQSFAQNAASQQNIITARNNASAAEEEARGQLLAQEALAGIYSDANYIAYLRVLAEQDCSNNDGCTMIITGSDGNVNVNTGSRAPAPQPEG